MGLFGQEVTKLFIKVVSIMNSCTFGDPTTSSNWPLLHAQQDDGLWLGKFYNQYYLIHFLFNIPKLNVLNCIIKKKKRRIMISSNTISLTFFSESKISFEKRILLKIYVAKTKTF